MSPDAPAGLIINGRSLRDRGRRPAQEPADLSCARDLDLTGAKSGCGIGVCGACTILVDDRPLRACRSYGRRRARPQRATIEGLAGPDGGLHPLQQAFIDHGAIQCGFCTPGMVLAAHAFLLKHPAADAGRRSRKAISANLCRCTGYQQIIDAIMAAAPQLPQTGVTA